MAGHLGHKKITTKSEIFFVNQDENILALKGSVPGPKGGELKILVFP
jgi:ribosomal protein L3